MAQLVKNPPAMQETQIQSLNLEGPLEKEMAIHSSILAWETPWTEGPGGPQSMSLLIDGYNLATKQQGPVIPFPSNRAILNDCDVRALRCQLSHLQGSLQHTKTQLLCSLLSNKTLTL